MQGLLTIGQLAKEAGVPISTVRYYEGRGLLEPEERTASRYRLYGPDALHRLRFIRAAQTSGFTLEDTSKLLELREALSALKSPLGNRREFRKQIEDILKDKDARARLMAELGLGEEG